MRRPQRRLKDWRIRGELGTVANTVRPARAEFGWIYLQSLIESAERRVDRAPGSQAAGSVRGGLRGAWKS